jgi:5-methylthioadenosine/S-adenosylhomocysteine deaminase
VSCNPAGASVIDTKGIILPGLIDTHNHILFDIFDETDWSPSQAYANHNQWTQDPRYNALVDAKQHLNGEGSPLDLGCELDKYGELKGLIAGTTSIVGAANPARSCYGTLARTIDQSSNGLGMDKVQVATLFPSAAALDGVCTNIALDKTDAYMIHIAEGTDMTALQEFTKLGSTSTSIGCAYAPETTIVHGTALGMGEFTTMAMHKMSLVWSPRSNVFLYGGGSNLMATTDIQAALSMGINIALAPDWSIGGSQNLLDELRFADKVDNMRWGDILSPETLTKMVTVNAAKALGLDGIMGSLEVGKKADVMVIDGDPAGPYQSLLAATPASVRLVLVGGVPLYGDAQLKPIAQQSPACESFDACCRSKFLCVAAPNGTPINKVGQTLADITSALQSELLAYDNLNLTPWDFSPLAPLLKCP